MKKGIFPGGSERKQVVLPWQRRSGLGTRAALVPGTLSVQGSGCGAQHCLSSGMQHFLNNSQ